MKTVTGYYGSQKTQCNVFTFKGWYCVEGSKNVNRTHDDIENGVNVEELSDYDVFTSTEPIESLEELVEWVNK